VRDCEPTPFGLPQPITAQSNVGLRRSCRRFRGVSNNSHSIRRARLRRRNAWSSSTHHGAKAGARLPHSQVFNIPILSCSNIIGCSSRQMNLPPSPNAISSHPIHLKNWPHAPAHNTNQAGAYIITSATYKKSPHLQFSRAINVPHQLPIRSGRNLPMATTSLGHIRKSLPFHCRIGKTAKPKKPDQASTLVNRNIRQPTGQHPKQKGLVPILGITPNLSTFLFRSPKLRAPKPCPPQPGKHTIPLPMVLSSLVQTKSHPSLLQNNNDFSKR